MAAILSSMNIAFKLKFNVSLSYARAILLRSAFSTDGALLNLSSETHQLRFKPTKRKDCNLRVVGSHVGFHSGTAILSDKKGRQRWTRDDAKISAEAQKHSDDLKTTTDVILKDRDDLQIMMCTYAAAETYAKQRKMKLIPVNERSAPKVYRSVSLEEFKELQKAQKATKVEKKENKTWKISSAIADHDFEIKMRDIVKLASDGHTVMLQVTYSHAEKDEALKEGTQKRMIERVNSIVCSVGTQVDVRLNRTGATQFVLCVTKKLVTDPKKVS